MKRKNNPFGVAFIICVVLFCVCSAVVVGLTLNQTDDVMEAPESVIFMSCFMMMFVSIILMVIFFAMGIYRAKHPVFEKQEGAHDEKSEHTILCPSCHEANPSTANFCEHCGASLQDAQREDLIYTTEKEGFTVPFGIMFRAQLFALKPQAAVHIMLIILSILLLTCGIIWQLIVPIVIASLFLAIYFLGMPLLIWIQYAALKKHLVSNVVRFYPDGFESLEEIENKHGKTIKKQFYALSLCRVSKKYKDYYFFLFNPGPNNLASIMIIHNTGDMKADSFLEESVKKYSKKRK